MGFAGQVYRHVERFVPDGAAPYVQSLRRQNDDVRQRLHRRRAEAAMADYLSSTVGNVYRPVDPGPVWTRDLVMQTAVQDEARVEKLLNPNRFFASSTAHMMRFLKVAEAHGFNLRTARAVYEMGCGSGRLIRHLRPVAGLRLVGSDINATSTAWCSANLPGIEFHQNDLDPPLTFAKDDEFDLAYAQSVFTHIPHDAQGAWLEELARVIRPGGYALLTVEGVVKQREMLTEEDFARLESEGVLTLDATHENVSASTKFTNTWDVFLLRPQILSTFGRHFDILDYLTGNQDLLVLRKPLPRAGPVGGPLPADPARAREAAAVWI